MADRAGRRVVSESLARNLAGLVARFYTYGGVRHETVYPGLPVAAGGVVSHFVRRILLLRLTCSCCCCAAFATLAADLSAGDAGV